MAAKVTLWVFAGKHDHERELYEYDISWVNRVKLEHQLHTFLWGGKKKSNQEVYLLTKSSSIRWFIGGNKNWFNNNFVIDSFSIFNKDSLILKEFPQKWNWKTSRGETFSIVTSRVWEIFHNSSQMCNIFAQHGSQKLCGWLFPERKLNFIVFLQLS